MVEFNFEHAKALYLRFCAIYGDKFYKPYHTDDFKRVWFEEWSIGLAGIDVNLIKDILTHCKVSLEWPPSIAEFRRLCEQASGIPSVGAALALAIRREFKHPIVKMAFDKVGSWEMKNGKDDALRRKFDEAYREALAVFRVNSESTWKMLEEFKAKPPKLEAPSKIPTESEMLGFKERLKQYTAMAADEKTKLSPHDHPVWEKSSITIGHSKFNQKVYEERCKYLMEMDELLASTMSVPDQYDRIILIREDIARKYVDSLKDGSHVPPKEKTSPRSFHGGKIIYKNWMGD